MVEQTINTLACPRLRNEAHRLWRHKFRIFLLMVTKNQENEMVISQVKIERNTLATGGSLHFYWI